jgi:hypothetical protein
MFPQYIYVITPRTNKYITYMKEGIFRYDYIDSETERLSWAILSTTVITRLP